MQLLESAWFFRMVEQHGKTPAQRLLAIFSITETWIAAPGIRESMLLEAQATPRSLYACAQLKQFLANIARDARARHPESLVNQLVILLQGAIAEEIRNPASGSIGEAGKAARAIVDKACRQRPNRAYLATGSIAAAMLVVLGGYYQLFRPSHQPVERFASQPAMTRATGFQQAPYNPDSVDAVLALQEQIDRGVCPAPQLLALPPGQVTAYMNVIHFRTPEDPAADRENIRAFMAWFQRTRSTECYMPPINGHTSVAWVARTTTVVR